MQRGIHRVLPEALVDCCPVADGGEGTAEVIATASAAARRTLSVIGPTGQSVDADFFLIESQRLAVLDMASAAGLMLVPQAQRDAMKATTFGVGELLLAARASGARRLIVGVGGSAGNDGGCGMAQALGVRFINSAGHEMRSPIGGADLQSIASIDVRGSGNAMRDLEIAVACDVDNPLTGSNGAAHVYAAQKGATAKQIGLLDAGLVNLARIVRRDLGIEIENLPRAGAAGGLAAGLLAFVGAKLQSGIDLVLDIIDFDRRVTDCDLCLTGEGRLDSQSLSGKACLGVARRAARFGVPTYALVGSTGNGAENALQHGLSGYELIGQGLSVADSLRRAEELLAECTARVVLRRAETGRRFP